eukprot:6175945-Pleurochrysis_carterae.AAC.1
MLSMGSHVGTYQAGCASMSRSCGSGRSSSLCRPLLSMLADGMLCALPCQARMPLSISIFELWCATILLTFLDQEGQPVEDRLHVIV